MCRPLYINPGYDNSDMLRLNPDLDDSEDEGLGRPERPRHPPPGGPGYPGFAPPANAPQQDEDSSSTGEDTPEIDMSSTLGDENLPSYQALTFGDENVPPYQVSAFGDENVPPYQALTFDYENVTPSEASTDYDILTPPEASTLYYEDVATSEASTLDYEDMAPSEASTFEDDDHNLTPSEASEPPAYSPHPHTEGSSSQQSLREFPVAIRRTKMGPFGKQIVYWDRPPSHGDLVPSDDEDEDDDNDLRACPDHMENGGPRVIISHTSCDDDDDDRWPTGPPPPPTVPFAVPEMPDTPVAPVPHAGQDRHGYTQSDLGEGPSSPPSEVLPPYTLIDNQPRGTTQRPHFVPPRIRRPIIVSPRVRVAPSDG